MERSERPDNHERFKELAAMAQTDSLSISEQLDLYAHLQACHACREIHEQYRLISGEGMNFLSGRDRVTDEAEVWDNRDVRRRLFAGVANPATDKVVSFVPAPIVRDRGFAVQSIRRWSALASAACVLLLVGVGAYRVGERRGSVAAGPVAPVSVAESSMPHELSAQASAGLSESQAEQREQVSKLEEEIARGQRELDSLRAVSKVVQEHADELASTNEKREADLRQLIEERDKLVSQLKQSEESNRNLQADLTSIRAERMESHVRTASLETRVSELSAANEDQARRLKDDEQYLTSDRDIRELMGARKLYIADVFDVDSVSRTRKPYGRVFYTQQKSLVFYAFDLDRQPGIKNASAFQVWGQKDSEANSQSHPTNLGILYMDSETNRRWVLRTDDAKQLAEIGAVFVTVEPNGGSQKPTGKPFLYALLRQEANHP